MRVISWSTCYDDPTYGSPLFVIQRRRRFHFDVIDARYDPRRLCCRIGTQGGRAYLHGERGSRKGLLTFKRRKNKKKKKTWCGDPPFPSPLGSIITSMMRLLRRTPCIGLKGIRVSTDDFIVISLLDLHERCIITPLANRPDKRLSFYGLIIE